MIVIKDETTQPSSVGQHKRFSIDVGISSNEYKYNSMKSKKSNDRNTFKNIIKRGEV